MGASEQKLLAQFRMFKTEIPVEYHGQMIDKKRLSVLVVGGAGYIGSHAARKLRRRGYKISWRKALN